MFVQRRIGALALLSSTALVLAGCAGPSEGNESDEQITLSYAFFGPATSFASIQIEEWAKEMNERTDGQVEVDIYVGGTLLGSGDIFEGVSQGVADVGLDSPAYDTSRFPLSSVINLPIGLTDPVVSSSAFLDLLLEFEPEEFSDYEIITAFTTEASYLQTLSPATSSADLGSTTLRGTAATIPVLEKLGTNPVALPMSDVSEQLSTSIIDGYASSREVLKEFGLAEQVRFVTDYPMGVSNSFVAVMNKAKFEALPENVKDVVLELREEMSQFAGEEHATRLEEALTFAEEAGVETVEVDPGQVEAWDQILDARADDWVEANSGGSFDSQAVLDRLRELSAANG